MAVYNIASLRVKMNPRPNGRIQKQAEKYLDNNQNDENIDIVIDVSDERIKQATLDNMPSTENEWEYVLTGADFYNALVNFNGMVLHSSCVVYGGKAYAFSAHSGTGKSTHTKLWLDYFGKDKAYILNDDKPALRLFDDEIIVYGTPWSGKHNISQNTSAPLKSICFLYQNETDVIKEMDIRKVVPAIFDQTTRQLEKAQMIKLFDVIDGVISKIPVYEMGCTISQEAVKTAYNQMSK